VFPHYSYPPLTILALIRDGLLKRPRRFRDDARACVARLQPPLRVLGGQNIPAGGCYVITFNHYYRPGFQQQWTSLAISGTISRDIHWIMTGELTFPGSWIAPLGMPLSRFVLARVAYTYGFTAMPPMPPRPQDVEARASAVREALRFAAHTADAILGLAPEGGDQPGGVLTMPPAGSGRFCLLLAAAGPRFLPAGVYEAGGALTLNFGEPYDLSSPRGGSADERDRLAAREVMSRIAALVPRELRGEFG
jgi:hypothetical protein